MLYIDFDQLDAFRSNISDAFSHDLGQITGGRVNNADMLSFFTALLMQAGQFEEAKHLSSSSLVQSLKLTAIPPKSSFELQSIQAVLRAYDGDTAEYIDLSPEMSKAYPCVKYMAINELYNLIKKTGAARPELDRLILKSLPGLEEDGVASFQFYNFWGGQEIDAGDYDAAMAKFATALKFEGDDEWALLNWGLAAYRKGDLALARDKYLKSLSLGTVPAAVDGLLATLAEQGDGETYLKEFEKYKSALQSSDYQNRSAFERTALIFACWLKKAPPAAILRNEEGITISGKTYQPTDFDQPHCDFPP